MAAAARTARLLLVVAQGALLAVSLYQSAVSLCGRLRGLPPPRERPASLPRIGAVVCVRNEASAVRRIVGDLLAQDYPQDRFDVIVAAHNCTDGTAAAARDAGARVIEVNTDTPGKIHGLRAALAAFGPGYDLIAAFDADSRVPDTLFAAVAAEAEGEDCLQVETVPQRPSEWLSGGHGLGRKARNLLWWRPRQALGLGTTISGTGFFIRPHVLAEAIQGAHTLTEDLEITAAIYASGRKVTYVSSTFVSVDEPHTLGVSAHQRLRWVRGHLGVVRHRWPAVAGRGIRGNAAAADMAVYLVAPSRVITRAGITVSVALALLRAPFALPLAPVLLAAAGEWLLPLWIAIRERILPVDRQGLRLAASHGILSLLWFPVGAWALLTARKTSWSPTPRSAPEEADATAVA